MARSWGEGAWLFQAVETTSFEVMRSNTPSQAIRMKSFSGVTSKEVMSGYAMSTPGQPPSPSLASTSPKDRVNDSLPG